MFLNNYIHEKRTEILLLKFSANINDNLANIGEEWMSNDEHATVLGKTVNHQEQKLVDERFNAESLFWTEAYWRTDVFGVNIRRRQAVALRYVEGLSLPKNARVLDGGCGAGFMAIALAQRGFMVDAIDHASAMIELTQSHAKQKGMDNRIRAAVEDVQELPFDDCSFELIVSLE